MSTRRREDPRQMASVELAIHGAIGLVSMLGPDARITKARLLLQQARDALGEYVDALVVELDQDSGLLTTPELDAIAGKINEGEVPSLADARRLVATARTASIPVRQAWEALLMQGDPRECGRVFYDGGGRQCTCTLSKDHGGRCLVGRKRDDDVSIPGYTPECGREFFDTEGGTCICGLPKRHVGICLDSRKDRDKVDEEWKKRGPGHR